MKLLSTLESEIMMMACKRIDLKEKKKTKNLKFLFFTDELIINGTIFKILINTQVECCVLYDCFFVSFRKVI